MERNGTNYFVQTAIDLLNMNVPQMDVINIMDVKRNQIMIDYLRGDDHQTTANRLYSVYGPYPKRGELVSLDEAATIEEAKRAANDPR